MGGTCALFARLRVPRDLGVSLLQAEIAEAADLDLLSRARASFMPSKIVSMIVSICFSSNPRPSR
ncbi:MAG: hypothetical protein MZV70_13530 [Desulfobacterales bacterium]|nr:hypothetical protein [Desulfobacterales bacterium]